jgi:hypothetical protein
MARKEDFYLQFGSNAEAFGGEIRSQLADARRELGEFGNEVIKLDQKLERSTGASGIRGLVQGLGEANTLVKGLVEELSKLGGEFQTIAQSLRQAASNVPRVDPTSETRGGSRQRSRASTRSTGGGDTGLAQDVSELGQRKRQIQQELASAEQRLDEVTTIDRAGKRRARPRKAGDRDAAERRIREARQKLADLAESADEDLDAAQQEVQAPAREPRTQAPQRTQNIEGRASQARQQVDEKNQRAKEKAEKAKQSAREADEIIDRAIQGGAENLDQFIADLKQPTRVKVGRRLGSFEGRIPKTDVMVSGLREKLLERIQATQEKEGPESKAQVAKEVQEAEGSASEALSSKIDSLKEQIKALTDTRGRAKRNQRSRVRELKAELEAVRERLVAHDEQLPVPTATETSEQEEIPDDPEAARLRALIDAIEQRIADFTNKEGRARSGKSRRVARLRTMLRQREQELEALSQEATRDVPTQAESTEVEGIAEEVKEGGEGAAQGLEAMASVNEQVANALQIIRAASERVGGLEFDKLDEEERKLIAMNRRGGGRSASPRPASDTQPSGMRGAGIPRSPITDPLRDQISAEMVEVQGAIADLQQRYEQERDPHERVNIKDRIDQAKGVLEAQLEQFHSVESGEFDMGVQLSDLMRDAIGTIHERIQEEVLNLNFLVESAKEAGEELTPDEVTTAEGYLNELREMLQLAKQRRDEFLQDLIRSFPLEHLLQGRDLQPDPEAGIDRAPTSIQRLTGETGPSQPLPETTRGQRHEIGAVPEQQLEAVRAALLHEEQLMATNVEVSQRRFQEFVQAANALLDVFPESDIGTLRELLSKDPGVTTEAARGIMRAVEILDRLAEIDPGLLPGANAQSTQHRREQRAEVRQAGARSRTPDWQRIQEAREDRRQRMSPKQIERMADKDIRQAWNQLTYGEPETVPPGQPRTPFLRKGSEDERLTSRFSEVANQLDLRTMSAISDPMPSLREQATTPDQQVAFENLVHAVQSLIARTQVDTGIPSAQELEQRISSEQDFGKRVDLEMVLDERQMIDEAIDEDKRQIVAFYDDLLEALSGPPISPEREDEISKKREETAKNAEIRRRAEEELGRRLARRTPEPDPPEPGLLRERLSRGPRPAHGDEPARRGAEVIEAEIVEFEQQLASLNAQVEQIRPRFEELNAEYARISKTVAELEQQHHRSGEKEEPEELIAARGRRTELRGQLDDMGGTFESAENAARHISSLYSELSEQGSEVAREFHNINEIIKDIESRRLTDVSQISPARRAELGIDRDEGEFPLRELQARRMSIMKSQMKNQSGIVTDKLWDPSADPEEIFQRYDEAARRWLNSGVTAEGAGDELRRRLIEEEEPVLERHRRDVEEEARRKPSEIEKAEQALRQKKDDPGSFQACCERIVGVLEQIHQRLSTGIRISGGGGAEVRRAAQPRERDSGARQLNLLSDWQGVAGEAANAEDRLTAATQTRQEATNQAAEREREISRESLERAGINVGAQLEGAGDLMPDDLIKRAAEFTGLIRDAGYNLDRARNVAGDQLGLDDDQMLQLRQRFEDIEAAARRERRERGQNSRASQQDLEREIELQGEQLALLQQFSQETQRAVMDARRLRADPNAARGDVEQATTRAVHAMEREQALLQSPGGRPVADARVRRTGMRSLIGVGEMMPDKELTEALGRDTIGSLTESMSHATRREAPTFQRTMGDAFFGQSGFMGRIMRSTGTFMVRNLSSGLVFGVTRMFRQLLREALETEAQFIRVSDALEATGRTAEGVRTELLGISVDLGRPLQDVYEVASNITGAFEDVRDVEFGTRIVAQLELISNGALTAKNGFDALQTIASAFELEGVRELERIQDTAVAIQNVMAIGVNDTIEGIGGMAGQAAELNMELEETAVLVAAVAKGTNQGGKAAAEQFGRILSTFETQRGRSTLLEAGIGNLGMFSEGDVGGIVFDMIESWDDLTEAQQRNIKATFGSRREARAFNALINRREQILTTLIETENAHGLGQQRVEEVMREMANQIRIASANFTNFGAVLVRSGVLNFFGTLLRGVNSVMSGVNEFFSTLNDLADRNPLAAFARDAMGVLLGLTVTMRGLGVAGDMMAASIARQAAAAGTLQGAMAMPVLGRRIARAAQAQGGQQVGGGGRGGRGAGLVGAVVGATGGRAARRTAQARIRENRAGRLINERGRFVSNQEAIDAGRMDPLTGVLLGAGLRGAAGRGASRLGGAMGSFGQRIHRAGTVPGRTGARAGIGRAAAPAGLALSKLGVVIAGLGPKAWLAVAALAAVSGGIGAISRAVQVDRERGESGFSLIRDNLPEEMQREIEEEQRQENLGFFARFTDRGREARTEEAEIRHEELQAMTPGERALAESQEQAEALSVRLGNTFRAFGEVAIALGDMAPGADLEFDIPDTSRFVERVEQGKTNLETWFDSRIDAMLDFWDDDGPMAGPLDRIAEVLQPGRESAQTYNQEIDRLSDEVILGFGPPAQQGQVLGDFLRELHDSIDIGGDGSLDFTEDGLFFGLDQDDTLARIEAMRAEMAVNFEQESVNLQRAYSAGDISETEFQARSAAIADAKRAIEDWFERAERTARGMHDLDHLMSDQLSSFMSVLSTIQGIDPRVLSQVSDHLDVMFTNLDLPEGSSWDRFMEIFLDEELTDRERQAGFLAAHRDALDEATRQLEALPDEADDEERQELEQNQQTALNNLVQSQRQMWDDTMSTVSAMVDIAGEIGGQSVLIADRAIQDGIAAVREQLRSTQEGSPEEAVLLQELRNLGSQRAQIRTIDAQHEIDFARAGGADDLTLAEMELHQSREGLAQLEHFANANFIFGAERDALFRAQLIEVMEREQSVADAIDARADAQLAFMQAQTEDPRIQATLGLVTAIDTFDRAVADGANIERLMALEAEILQLRREERDAIDRVANAEMERALSQTRDPREQALIRLRNALDAQSHYDGDDPVELASRDAAVNQAEQELLDQARAERDAVAQTRVAMQRDPEIQLLMEMELARIELIEAADQGIVAVEQARQNLIRLEQSLEDQRNQIRMTQFQTRIGTTEDPLRQAMLSVQAAREEMRQAVGQQDRLAAHASIVDARRAEADAISAIAAAQLDLASAIANAGGDQIRVAQLQLEAAQHRLQEAKSRNQGAAAIAQARAGVVQAEAQMRDAVLQDHMETIEFNREMGVITQGEAIQAMQTILQEMELTRDQRRQLLRQINGMQDELRSQLTGSGFNIPAEINLPTAYMVRRSLGIDEMDDSRLPDEWRELSRFRMELDDDLTEPLSSFTDALSKSGDRIVSLAQRDSERAIDTVLQEYATLGPRMDSSLQALTKAHDDAWAATEEAAGRGASRTNMLSLSVISELDSPMRRELDKIESSYSDAWGGAREAADYGSRSVNDVIADNLRDGVSRVSRIVQGFGSALADALNPVLTAVGEPEIKISNSYLQMRTEAKGGFSDDPLPRQATIQNPHGTNGLVQWAEKSTHGEAFIPLSPANRPRSVDIWRETGRRLGVESEFESFAAGGLRSPNYDRTHGGTVYYGGWTHNLAPYVIHDVARILNATPGAQGISSAYRSPDHNRRVGGAPNSDHMFGHAVDIIPLGPS